MTMRRYAGFDPTEDDFDDVEPAPLHDEDLKPPPRVIRTRLDRARIAHLRGLGWTWVAIGKQIAIEQQRRVPYSGNTVWSALRCAKGSK